VRPRLEKLLGRSEPFLLGLFAAVIVLLIALAFYGSHVRNERDIENRKCCEAAKRCNL